ncbi:MAG: stage V sporulation protein AE [Clostridia bacterium]|nr:stage V sporulation protein AE [Clostridia bacterium]
MNYLNAFWVGGLICAIGQILIDKTKLTPARILVSFVCIGAFLSLVGVYKPFVEYAGAGASVPILGFGHSLFQGIVKSIEEDGFIGILKGGLAAVSAGLTAVILFGFLAGLIFKPKTK